MRAGPGHDERRSFREPRHRQDDVERERLQVGDAGRVRRRERGDEGRGGNGVPEGRVRREPGWKCRHRLDVAAARTSVIPRFRELQRLAQEAAQHGNGDLSCRGMVGDLVVVVEPRRPVHLEDHPR